jgi:hypothetical protein
MLLVPHSKSTSSWLILDLLVCLCQVCPLDWLELWNSSTTRVGAIFGNLLGAFWAEENTLEINHYLKSTRSGFFQQNKVSTAILVFYIRGYTIVY